MTVPTTTNIAWAYTSTLHSQLINGYVTPGNVQGVWLPTLPCSVNTPAHPWTFLRPSQEKKPLILLLIRLRRKFFLVVFSFLLCRLCKGVIPCRSPRDESDTIERTRDGTKSLSQKFVFRLPCFPPQIINNISSAKRVPAAWGRRPLLSCSIY